MQDQRRAKIRRILIWFTLNLIIFTACYLNYRLQLKHRYLYRTLSVGLCFSRAAAMVINFNLLLVWLPMCKYTLTRLSCIANGAFSGQKRKLQQIINQMASDKQASATTNHYISQSFDIKPTDTLDKHQYCCNNALAHYSNYQIYTDGSKALNCDDICKTSQFIQRVKSSLNQTKLKMHYWIGLVKINYIKSFLIAVDHSTSLHTICATTITLASINHYRISNENTIVIMIINALLTHLNHHIVVHTVAHLMNVINFSKNFDPLLSSLNMAEYKGQNPFQLLVSVPGITGCLMIIILLLMSLSSIDVIRNSSFDLFQVFHRLSIIFVILLVIHPSSHILKEQANVQRHHPDYCHPNDWIINNNNTASKQRDANKRATPPSPPGGTAILAPKISDPHGSVYNNKTGRHLAIEAFSSSSRSFSETPSYESIEVTIEQICLDKLPTFVAQSTICWYVLVVGLSCYLLDLLLRRLRRSRNTIKLLQVRSDGEGNLIELILSSNHRRFAHWLPGQFVYLNCPQIATYEWHPFTISSFNKETNQFTLHIKTGGDWTRKLRHELGIRLKTDHQVDCLFHQYQDVLNNSDRPICKGSNFKSLAKTEYLPDRTIIDLSFKQLDSSGKANTTKLDDDNYPLDNNNLGNVTYPLQYNDSIKLNNFHNLPNLSLDQTVLNNNQWPQKTVPNTSLPPKNLGLFIDGPFHSPFERLLEQEVSVCIANGVGWTAFSSIFQNITNNEHLRLKRQEFKNDWWSKWQNYAYKSSRNDIKSSQNITSNNTTTDSLDENHFKVIPTRTINSISMQQQSNLHLLIIVATIDQLKPFYNIATKYFDCISCSQLNPRDKINGDQDESNNWTTMSIRNPVQQLQAYITRSTLMDADVQEFCHQERLSHLIDTNSSTCFLQINKFFSINFGKPNFETYLESFSKTYPDKHKISVYCCGSYQVKKVIKEICHDLNKISKNQRKHCSKTGGPTYSYHEENF